MKYLYLCGLLIVIASISSTAQISYSANTPTSKWSVRSFNLNLGLDWARYNSMTLDGLMAFAAEPEKMKRNLQGLEEDARTTTGGAALYFSLSLSPLNRSTGIYRKDQELRLGIALYSPKEAMVSYKNENLDTSIVYCNLHSELALEGAYLFKGEWGRRWQWQIGGGLNTGLTFGNEMVLMSGRYFEEGQHPSEQEQLAEERYQAKQAYYVRGFIPYGLYFKVSEGFALGLEGRSGRGLQLIEGGRFNVMRKAGALMLGLRAGL